MVQSVRTPACHAGGRGFKSLLGRHHAPCERGINFAAVAQSVERILGKDEVTSSNLVSSSKKACDYENHRLFLFCPLFPDCVFWGKFGVIGYFCKAINNIGQRRLTEHYIAEPRQGVAVEYIPA